jgi:phenylalanyl-tRNA synthetase beta chain
MKIPESWLREFVDPPLDNETLAYRLTMAGLEVEENAPVAPFFEHVVVGQILTVAPHGNADRLRICSVDVGEPQPLQIVCGAPNAQAGLKIPCAKVGAVLPGNMTITLAKVRGIESFGMLCSAKELGLNEEPGGLLVLPADAPVGQDFRQYYALDERILTLKLTPNRADCLSIYGVAREVAAITQTCLNAYPSPTVTVALQDTLSVTVKAQAACPRYYGRLIRGVNAAAPTPEWMQRKLARSGLRSLSAIVDITNYVMLELGQPLHAFDAQAIQQAIIVRWAESGEKLTLLNEKEVILKSDMLVIADQEKPLALAGMMGGLVSAVKHTTTDVFLESAFFIPSVIAGRSRQLGLNSDAAYRYERGVDSQLAGMAIEQATALILQICGGEAGPVNKVETTSPARATVAVRLSKINAVLGVAIPEAQVINYLSALGMAPVIDKDTLTVTVPSYRFDIAIEEDVIEEVGRLYGYDHIPARPAYTALRILSVPGTHLTQAQIQTGLVARDYHEVITYAFVDKHWEQDFAGNRQPVKLQNPIASQMSVMRSSLVGGLVECLRKNVNRQHERIRIFEIGRVFISQAEDIEQPEKLAGLAYGPRYQEQWSALSEKVDFYDVKKDIEALLQPKLLRFEKFTHPALHPGRAAQVLYQGEVIGLIGELHPQWVQKYALPQAPIVFELSLAALKVREPIKAAPFSRQPAVRRDLAFIVEETVPVQYLVDTLQAVPNVLLQSVTLFDVYKGPGIEAGKKSLAFKVIMQDSQKTLTDNEVDTAVAQLIAAVREKYDAILRI